MNTVTRGDREVSVTVSAVAADDGPMNDTYRCQAVVTYLHPNGPIVRRWPVWEHVGVGVTEAMQAECQFHVEEWQRLRKSQDRAGRQPFGV